MSLSFCGPHGLCHNCSTLPLHQESSHRPCVNEWVWLSSNKTLFTKPGLGHGFNDSRSENHLVCRRIAQRLCESIVNYIVVVVHCSVVSNSLQLHGTQHTPGFPVLHYLPNFAQTHVHWVGDAIQPSHPLYPLLDTHQIFSILPQKFKSHILPLLFNLKTSLSSESSYQV